MHATTSTNIDDKCMNARHDHCHKLDQAADQEGSVGDPRIFRQPQQGRDDECQETQNGNDKRVMQRLRQLGFESALLIELMLDGSGTGAYRCQIRVRSVLS